MVKKISEIQLLFEWKLNLKSRNPDAIHSLAQTQRIFGGWLYVNGHVSAGFLEKMALKDLKKWTTAIAKLSQKNKE